MGVESTPQKLDIITSPPILPLVLSSSNLQLSHSQSIHESEPILQLDGNSSFIDNLDLFLSENSSCEHIPVVFGNRPEQTECENARHGSNRKNLRTIHRSNKLIQAADLPIVITLNPRSLYNKKSNFRTLIEQTDAGICFVSETWERSHKENAPLISEILDIDGYKWVQNVMERNVKGGKPAMLIKEENYFITNLCPEIVTVPVGVEAAWALLTKKSRSSSSNVKHIVVASLYYSSTQTKKGDFLDHISSTYHTLCAKYGSDLKFILSGDINRLNVKQILHLSRDLKQVVEVPTRRNPDAILDVIITNIAALYNSPVTLPPLENDDDLSGAPSDHMIVIMRPISCEETENRRKFKTITFRSFPDSAIREMGKWLQSQSWSEIYYTDCPEMKVAIFENYLLRFRSQIFFCNTSSIFLSDLPTN